MSDPDRPSSGDGGSPRAQPQYGEYATPEEQRARIKQPDLTWMLENGQDPDAAPAAPAPAPVAPPMPRPAVGAPRRRFADRVATVALLVYGLVNVVTSIPAMIDYESYVSTVLSILGINGELANPGAGRAWGIAAAFVIAIGWLLTAYVSWLTYSRGHVTWWIPLVAGIVFTFISGVLLMVPIIQDPVLWQSILTSTTP